MKKLLAWLLTCVLLLTSVSAVLAEADEEQAVESESAQATYFKDEITVAVTTPLTGNFFTNMWGNLSSDLDVRNLIHGYNLVEWDTEEGVFLPDSSVVRGSIIDREDNGDYTFTLMLYQDLCYNDGTQITARDYAFSLLLTMSPEMKELGANVRTPEYIAGYKDYISGKSETLKGVKLLGDYILDITIDKVYLPFFYQMGLLDCVPYPISVIAPGVEVADDGDGIYLENAEKFTADVLKKTVLDEKNGYRTHPKVTSGPYTLVSYEDGRAEFEINPLYKGNSEGEKPQIERINVVSKASDELIPALKNGSVTVLNKVSDAQAIADGLKLAEEQPVVSASYDRSGLSFISFNTDRTPMDDLAVRQAIAYLADRDSIAKEVLGDYGMRAEGYFGMGQWMYLLLSGKVTPEEPDEYATNAEKAAYSASMKKLKNLSLDTIEKYNRSVKKAAKLLDAAGWNLNKKGKAFNAKKDKVRYKKTADGLKPLQLTLAYAEGSAAGKALEGTLVKSLAEGGIELKVEAIPTEKLFKQYYRQAKVKYDMFFLGTNFDVVYDPSTYFTETKDGHHQWKTNGLVDDQMWKLTVDMRKTEPGDLAGYCEKWLKYQKRISEQLPVLAIYSNTYYDFYPEILQGYEITSSISWPQTIIGAYIEE